MSASIVVHTASVAECPPGFVDLTVQVPNSLGCRPLGEFRTPAFLREFAAALLVASEVSE